MVYVVPLIRPEIVQFNVVVEQVLPPEVAVAM
jgi:hypothetical protein